MTSYIAITDTETDPEAPLTATLAKKWRDNPIAIAEGDASVPANLRPTVFLGQLNTTSGNSQTLSGLSLTNYKTLHIVLSGVSSNTAGSYLYIYSGSAPRYIIGGASPVGTAWSGVGTLDLSTGVCSFVTKVGVPTDPASNTGSFVVEVPYFTTSTSITFVNTNFFDAGLIQVWGVK